MQFRILQGRMAGFCGLPVTQQDVVRFAVAVEKVAAVSLGGDDGTEFAEGGERRGFHARDGLPDGHRKYLLRHTVGL